MKSKRNNSDNYLRRSKRTKNNQQKEENNNKQESNNNNNNNKKKKEDTIRRSKRIRQPKNENKKKKEENGKKRPKTNNKNREEEISSSNDNNNNNNKLVECSKWNMKEKSETNWQKSKTPVLRRSLSDSLLHSKWSGNNNNNDNETLDDNTVMRVRKDSETNLGFSNGRFENLCYINAPLNGIFYASKYLKDEILNNGNDDELVKLFALSNRLIENGSAVDLEISKRIRTHLRDAGWCKNEVATQQQDSMELIRFLIDKLELKPFWELTRKTLHSGVLESHDQIEETGSEIVIEFDQRKGVHTEQKLRQLVLVALERQFIRIKRKKLKLSNKDINDEMIDETIAQNHHTPNAVQLRQFKTTPDILLISIKRYRLNPINFGRERLKIALEIPCELVDLPGCDDQIFRLVFAVCHIPSRYDKAGVKAGHYVCYYFDGEHWYLHDDLAQIGGRGGRKVISARCKKSWLKVKDEIKKNCYYLLYERGDMRMPALRRSLTEPMQNSIPLSL